MKVNKVINNNLVRSHDLNNEEILVMGCGLGFKKNVGDHIDSDLIEKIYKIEDGTTANKLVELLRDMPLEHIQVANLIIDVAKRTLDKQLSDNIYITVTDHISFAIERINQGVYLRNALMWEIEKYYKSELQVGREALEIVNRELGISLPDDEAGYIAIHLVSACIEGGDSTYVAESVSIIESIISIIRFHFNVDIDEGSLAFDRFMVHLKFFTERVYKHDVITSKEDLKFTEMMKNHFQEEFKCSLKVRSLIEANYNLTVSDEELIYLAVHIRRIIN